jgi:hypothetical protein
MKILGDVLIPGSAELALSRILSAVTLYEPSLSEEAWQMTHAIATPINFTYPKRIWWRISNNVGMPPAYISLNPGEHRTVEPQGPNDVVWDPEKSKPAQSLGEILRSAVEDSKSEAISQTHALEKYRSYATDVLADYKRPSHARALKLFRHAASELRRTGAVHQQQLANELYDVCLHQYRLPVSSFSLCMLLLQLQGMCNQWIEQDVYADMSELSSFYFTYVRMMAKGDTRTRLTESLRLIGNTSYSDGKNSIKAGLNSYSLQRLTKLLSLGAHQYLTALSVATANQKLGLGMELDYTLLVAEEGFACTITGIMSGFEFFLNHPDLLVRDIIQKISSNDPLDQITRGLCSAIFPTFTKFFAETLVTRAMTMEMSPQFSTGLDRLKELDFEQSTKGDPMSGVFESSWLNHCLLNAYKVSGDEDMVKSYAIKIAAQMIAGKVLGV